MTKGNSEINCKGQDMWLTETKQISADRLNAPLEVSMTGKNSGFAMIRSLVFRNLAVNLLGGIRVSRLGHDSNRIHVSFLCHFEVTIDLISK